MNDEKNGGYSGYSIRVACWLACKIPAGRCLHFAKREQKERWKIRRSEISSLHDGKIPLYFYYKTERIHSYNRGNMARKFLPGCRKRPDYGWAMGTWQMVPFPFCT
ncbi:hypothetical protein B4098_3032 [Heyndrickxia coagulans]|uniref:Uncharacterized protein n=1 Tax=Heyndrickxia coagulans TaxID=1398 RepID=A0A150JUQ9_HEYCO|nr:hypothetical protein B4098_3032 [Heyndrickxia coagulans]